MKNLKTINDFAHNNGVIIDINFGYASGGVSINIRIGNFNRFVILTKAELRNAKVDLLTVLKLMHKELLAAIGDDKNES